jgi:acetyl esterase/lipase
MRSEELPAFFDGLEQWASARSGPVETFSYGDHPDQVVDLRLPDGPGPHSLALVLHGGFWRAGFTRRNTAALSVAMVAAGWGSANVEYRRLGPVGWQPMLADVLAARRRLGSFDHVVAVGHSAGGHLALWLAAEGAVDAAVVLGGVCDLAAAARAGLGVNAVQELLGGSPEEVAGAYLVADPAARLPFGVPQLLVHGMDDDRVPISHARAYAERARDTGDECRVVEVGGGHFAPIDPRSAAWPAVVTAVGDAMFASGSGVVA